MKKRYIFIISFLLALFVCVAFVGCDGNGGETDAVTPPEKLGELVFSKISERRTALTLNEGEEITYVITVENRNGYSVKLPVVDELPENTTFVSGDVTPSGKNISFFAELSAGETKNFSYKVKVNEDMGSESKILPATAKIYDKTAECNENYVGQTFSLLDEKYMTKGINAVEYSENVDPVALINMAYRVAFSASSGITGTAESVIDGIFSDSGSELCKMVVPTLWGGSEASDNGFLGRSTPITSADLISGDVIVMRKGGARIFIYDGKNISEMTSGHEKRGTDAILGEINGAELYAVLRPSLVMTSFISISSDPLMNDGLNEYQKALIATAKAYTLRGYRLQYDDGRFASNSEYRWQIGLYQPEDYTEQKWGYINCAGFTYDVYRTALGYDLGEKYTTKSIMNYFTGGGKESDAYPFYYEWNAETNSDSEAKAAVEKRFLETLEVGDLIVITRGTSVGGYGHVMLYIGDGMVIHSSGSTRQGDTEYYEATMRYMNISTYLFDPDASNYLFKETPAEKTVYQTCIARPLANFKGFIPKNTVNRMNNLDDILSEKLSSHPEGKTADRGDEITFTFKLQNLGSAAKTIEVADTVPENAELVSASGASVDGRTLVWSVTVGAGETVTVSYTVRAVGEYGSYIESKVATVGGVLHGCPKVYIEKTLTPQEEAAILGAVEYFRDNNSGGLSELELVNAIYVKAGLEAPFVDENGNAVDIDTLRNSLFMKSTVKSNMWTLNVESEYYEMLIPTLYGGGNYYTKNYYSSYNKQSSDRSRLPREQALVFGDIIVVRFSSSYATYMYVGGDHLVKLDSALSHDSGFAVYHRLQRMLSAGNYYAILRPSMAD